jgi:hypothetical protein
MARHRFRSTESEQWLTVAVRLRTWLARPISTADFEFTEATSSVGCNLGSQRMCQSSFRDRLVIKRLRLIIRLKSRRALTLD